MRSNERTHGSSEGSPETTVATLLRSARVRPGADSAGRQYVLPREHKNLFYEDHETLKVSRLDFILEAL